MTNFGQIILTGKPQEMLTNAQSTALVNSRTIGSGYWIMQDGRKTVNIFVYDPFQDGALGSWPIWDREYIHPAMKDSTS